MTIEHGQRNEAQAALEGKALRSALAAYPSGVVAMCALVDGAPVGMAVNSFTSVSLDPPLVSISVARTSMTWQHLRSAEHVGLSVLSADQEVISRSLSGPRDQRFAHASWESRDCGAVHICGAALHLRCRRHDSFDGGDHIIVLYEVVEVDHFPERFPLVFHGSRYRSIDGA
ncbi:flavin reductase family protein [Demequina sp. SO4-18]|uniref:flavin reductase family protein n=1 Tax=Demequina sp. SO4-18 TaxID=3401026 RepID=UPI003B5C263C